MKKTVLITVLITAVLATAILGMTAWSQGGGRGQGGPGGPGRQGGPGITCPAMAIILPPPQIIDRMAAAIGLTEDQVTKLKEITAKSETTMPTLTKASADATKALKTALVAATYDEKKVKELATAAEKAEAALLSARIDDWTKIRAILTADQAAKLQERPRMGPPPGGQGAPPPPPPGEEGAPPPPPPGGDQ